MTNLDYISPFFIVASLQASISYYTGKLGFIIRYIGPDLDPYWVIVGRDNISIMLKASGTAIPNHTLHEWARWDAYISTKDPDKLFEEYQSNGVSFSKPIHDNSDHLRGFELADPDGYILFFGRPNG
jgi:catechol 2,3-dioxygenase-like lactoylglutathione lyase family enzyme